LKRICYLKIAENDTVETLIFYGVSMTWEVEDIVEHLVEKIDQKRKRNNRKIRENHENEEVQQVNPVNETVSDVVVVPVREDVESEDERIVMEELNENVHTVRSRLFSEIKHLIKFVLQKRRFDGYTSKTDKERLYMVAEYIREKQRNHEATNRT